MKPLLKMLVAGLLMCQWSVSAAAEKVDFNKVRELIVQAPLVAGSKPPRDFGGDPAIGKPVVVSFFASWCPPCRKEFEHLNAVIKKMPPQSVQIIALNVFENWGGKPNLSRMKRFLARTRPAFVLRVGNDAILKAFGNITRIPTLVVFDSKGREVWRFTHQEGATKMFATTADIMAALKKADQMP